MENNLISFSPFQEPKEVVEGERGGGGGELQDGHSNVQNSVLRFLHFKNPRRLEEEGGGGGGGGGYGRLQDGHSNVQNSVL